MSSKYCLYISQATCDDSSKEFAQSQFACQCLFTSFIVVLFGLRKEGPLIVPLFGSLHAI